MADTTSGELASRDKEMQQLAPTPEPAAVSGRASRGRRKAAPPAGTDGATPAPTRRRSPARAAPPAAEVRDAEQRLERLRTEAREVEVTLESVRRALAEAREQAGVLQAAIRSAAGQMGPLRQQAGGLTGELGVVRQGIRHAHVDLRTLREQSRAAVEGICEARRSLASAVRQSGAVDRHSREAERRLEVIRHEAREIDASERRARTLAAEARGAALAAGQALGATRWQADQARDEFQRLRHEAVDAIAELRRLRDESRPEPAPHEAAVTAERPEEPAVPAPSEAVTDEPAADDPVALSNGSRTRLVRYLNDAWAVERTMFDTLQTMADEVTDAGLRAALLDHRAVTHQQMQRLDDRRRELGGGPTGSPGFLHQMLSRAWDALHRPPDGVDRTLHDVMKAYGANHFEAALYQAVEAIAQAAGDPRTARLAGEHLRQEQAAAERLHAFITPTATRSVGDPAVPSHGGPSDVRG